MGRKQKLIVAVTSICYHIVPSSFTNNYILNAFRSTNIERVVLRYIYEALRYVYIKPTLNTQRYMFIKQVPVSML